MAQQQEQVSDVASDAIEPPSPQSTWDSPPSGASSPPRYTTRRDSKPAPLSLAGPQRGPRHLQPYQTWYDEDYAHENPWMTQQDESPAFTLAGNFPRTTRWRRKPGKGQPETIQPAQGGEREVAPQVPSAEEQARDEDEDAVDHAINPQEEEDIKQKRRLQPQRSCDTQTAQARRYQDQAFPEITDPNRRPFNPWSVVRLKYQRPLGEFLGTTIFIFLGLSCNLSVTVSQNQAGTLPAEYLCWGLAVMIGIYISGGSSGAFLNPVIVITLCIFRGFPAKRLPCYILAQIFGAFVGALFAFAVYRDSILELDGALLPDSTGVSFYTQPRGPYISISTAFLTELLGSAILCCTILALGDSGNSPPGAGMHAFIIGLLVTTCTMALSWNTRGCFNPARDFGPRLAALAVGYPPESFTAWHHWWIWGAWAAPITGGLLGGLVYDLCVFKGGESPVNYSFRRWHKEGVKTREGLWRRVLGRREKAEGLQRRMESGELETKEEENWSG